MLLNIQDFFNYLNQNAGAFSVLFSAVVALSTAFYALLTARLVSETRNVRKAQTEPRLSVSIQPREEWISGIDMVIENIGMGPAYDIRFKIGADFDYLQGRMLSQLGFITNGIAYLAPKQRLQFFFTSMLERSEEKLATVILIHSTYRDANNHRYQDTHRLDFSYLKELGQLGDPPLHAMAQSLKELNKNIDSLVTGWKKLNVIVTTPEEEQRALAERLRIPDKHRRFYGLPETRSQAARRRGQEAWGRLRKTLAHVQLVNWHRSGRG